MSQWPLLLLSLAAGLASGIQGPANGSLARSVGLPKSVALNGAIVFGGTLLGLLLFDQKMPARAPLPWTHYVGGFCGLTVICVAAAAAPRIGAADYTVALVLGMLFASVCVDTWGWFGQVRIPLSSVRVAALVLIAAGVVLLRWTRAR